MRANVMEAAAAPRKVMTLEGCLARQADRRQMGVVAYDARNEHTNFAAILCNLTAGEKLRVAVAAVAVSGIGGVSVLLLWFGMRQLVGLILQWA